MVRKREGPKKRRVWLEEEKTVLKLMILFCLRTHKTLESSLPVILSKIPKLRNSEFIY